MKNKLIIFIIIVFVFASFSNVSAATNLSGRILLQVEEHGEAWYVNPVDNLRYYLGRPDDAFEIMRNVGLGAKTSDINKFLFSSAPTRLSGRILLQVEDDGQAYYVNPVNLKLYYLGRPADAFSVMRNLGLGITNSNLAKISIGGNEKLTSTNLSNSNSSLEIEETLRNYTFKYNNEQQNLSINLSPSLYQNYANSPKIYTYQLDSPPPNIQESFYEIFLGLKTEDDSIKKVANQLKAIAQVNDWHGDQLVELAFAFVQYIPYDNAKVLADTIAPYYPYETLYLNKGVCSDKTFLSYLILKELGYGVAILDFPDINHSALGIACDGPYSLRGSGYCYAETTNYFPITVIPQNISGGQAESTSNNYSNLFSDKNLGKIEIHNISSGNIYLGADEIKKEVEILESLYNYIMNNRPATNASYSEINEYNEKVDLYNKSMSDFYQQ